MKSIYVKVDDFGLGPACGFLDVTAPVARDYRWHILAVGNAARYIAKERPEAKIFPYGGFSSRNWSDISTAVPAESIILTMSNPPFAAWAAQQGYQVGLIDQLDWMWNANPEGIELLKFNFAQYYFGRSTTKTKPLNQTVIQPITIPHAGLSTSNREEIATIIGFGGMAIAGDPHGCDAYARWLIPLIVSALEGYDAFPIYVVGGSPSLQAIVNELGDNRIIARTDVPRWDYLAMLRKATYQILTPGLASIYEASSIGISPLFQPGAHDSMLLQLHSLIESGYPFTASWPWHHETVSNIYELPSHEACTIVTERVCTAIEGDHLSNEAIKTSVHHYVLNREKNPLIIHFPPDLPDGSELLKNTLSQM